MALPNERRRFIAELLRATIPPERIVVEVLENATHGDAELCDAVKTLRQQGFFVALDDFGAEHSNIDRVWSLKPDIVKA